MINVLGDAYGAGIVQHLSKDDLEGGEVQSEDVIDADLPDKPEIVTSDANTPDHIADTEHLIKEKPPEMKLPSVRGSDSDLRSFGKSTERLNRSSSTVHRLDHGYSEKSLYTTDFTESDEDDSLRFTTYL